MNKNIEIVTLIYKSVNYLYLITNQLKSNNFQLEGWNVGVRLVLNDATDEIKEEVKKLDINYSIFENPDKSEYYLNRVYRAWNFGGTSSEYDNICFVNSDMIFTRYWLDNLLKHHNGINIPTSRLVESGKLSTAPGRHGIVQNFGKTVKDVDFWKIQTYADQISQDKTERSGLLMPVVFEKKRFIETGTFPEGNVYTTGIGNFGDPLIAPGDVFYFNKLEKEYGMKHITVFDSIVYHIQEGEKDA